MKNLFTNLMKNTAKSSQDTGGGASQCQTSRSEGARQITARFESAQMKNTSLISACSTVDVPMPSYGAPDEHPMSIRSASDERRWNSRGWKYVACMLMVLFMGVGQMWATYSYNHSTSVPEWTVNFDSWNGADDASTTTAATVHNPRLYYDSSKSKWNNHSQANDIGFDAGGFYYMYQPGTARQLPTGDALSALCYVVAKAQGSYFKYNNTSTTVSSPAETINGLTTNSSQTTDVAYEFHMPRAGYIRLLIGTDSNGDPTSTANDSWKNVTLSGATTGTVAVTYHASGATYDVKTKTGATTFSTTTYTSAGKKLRSVEFAVNSGTTTMTTNPAKLSNNSGTARKMYIYAVEVYMEEESGGGGGCTSHSVNLSSSGSVTGGTFATNNATVCEGATATLTATPAAGYEFTSWSATGTGGHSLSSTTTNPATLTMGTADVTVNATFSQIDYTVSKTLTNCAVKAGSSAIPSTMHYGDDLSTIIEPTTGNLLPGSITVSGVTSYTWNALTGALTLTDVTGNVSISIVAATPQTGSGVTVTYAMVTSGSTAATYSTGVFSDILSSGTPNKNTLVASNTLSGGNGVAVQSDKNTPKNSRTAGITSSTDDFSAGSSPYAEFTFDVVDGYTFTPTAISVPVLAITYNAYFTAIVTDGSSTWTSATSECTEGAQATINATPSGGSALTGTVNIRVFCHNQATAAKGFRFGTDDVTITGTVAAAPSSGYTITNGIPLNGTIAITDGSSDITSAAEDDDVYITATPNTGYSFSSWNIYKTDDDKTTVTPASASASTSFSMPAYDVTVDASFSANSYTVTLDPDEGSSTSTVTATYGSAMPSTLSDGKTAVSVPTYSGYTFGGYYDDHAGVGNQYYPDDVASEVNWNKTSNTTLYAKWTQSVKIDDNGGSADGSVSVTYKGSAGTPSVPTYDGHTVDLGYYAESSCTNKVMNLNGSLVESVTVSTVPWTNSSSKWVHAGSSTLYAHWKCNTPEISCTANTVTISVPSGATVYYTTTTDGSTPDDPTSSDDAYNPESKPTISADTKIKAIAIQDGCTSSAIASATLDYVAYRVTYAGNGNTGGTVPTDDADYTSGSTVTVKADVPTKTDYTFVGWLNSVDNTIYKAGHSFTITAATTLTALWDGAGTTVTLSWFDSSQGSSSSNKPDSEGKWIYGYTNSAKTSGYAYTITTTNTNNKGQGTGDSDYLRLDYGTSYNIYANNTTTTGTPSTFSNVTAVSLKVKLNKDAPTMTIKVGGTTIANAVSLSDANKSSFITFTYNNLSNLSGKITITNNGSGSTNYNIFIDDITITCGVPATGYTVTFDKGGQDGATGMPANIEGVPSGKKIAEPLETPTLAGYTFDGWVTTSGGSTPFDFANTTITADKTIYAKWTALPASTTPVLPTLSNTAACDADDFTAWNATPTNATTIFAAGETVTYSWKNSSDVEVANTASYEPAAGTYTVTVTVSKAGQADASVTSDALTATLNTAASKTAEPTATIAAIEGKSFTISGLTASNATGYQWYSCNSTGGDKSELSDKTSATLTDTKEDAGTYYYICTIGNACGDDIDSRVVTVNVYDKCFEITDARKDKDNWGDDKANGVQITDTHIQGSITGGTVYSTGSAALGANAADGLVMEANKQITVTLSSGSFQVGTLIQIVAHSSNNGASGKTDNNKYSGLKVGSHTLENQYKCTSNTPAAFTQTYTVVADDGIAGRNSITIEYAGDAKTYLYSMVVANCALCTPISPTLTYSTSTLYVDPAPTTATATLTGYYGTPTISYASSNTSVANVDASTGEVTAVAPGTATITATIGETTVSTTDYCGAVAEAVITVAGCSVQEIAGVTLTSTTSADEDNATLIKNSLQDSSPGYKLNGNGAKFGMTLSGDAPFRVGDIINIKGTMDANPTVNDFAVYSGETAGSSSLLYHTTLSASATIDVEIEVTEDNLTALNTSKKVVVVRSTGSGEGEYNQNPHMTGMYLKRYSCSEGLAEFTGDGDDALWSTTENWAGGKVPTIEDRVILNKPMVVNVANAQAAEVILDQSDDNNVKLEIQANKGLEVAGKVQVWNGSALSATTPSDLYIGSGTEGNGTLIFENDGNAATVQMYSIGDIDGGTWNWQFMGTPFTSANALYSYYGSYLYEWKADGSGWTAVANGGTMSPFTGYCITQDAPAYYVMEGTLNPTTSKTLTVPAGVEMVFANSWSAPIDIGTFTDDAFDIETKTVYLFNTGYTPDDPATEGTGAGTYIAVPIHSSPYTGNELIAPMQGFYVDNTGGSAGSITMDYATVVRPTRDRNIVAGPMHAPKRIAATEEPAVMKLKATGSRYSERVVILEREDFSTGFDNGWDGKNLNEPGVAPILYTLREDGTKDAVSAIPTYEGTVVGFRNGEDNFYTFSFEYDGEDNWYLNDLKEQKSTLINAAETYEFVAEPGDTEARFVISATPIHKIATGNESAGAEAANVRKLIIDDKVYIIRGGRMYSVDGQMIK